MSSRSSVEGVPLSPRSTPLRFFKKLPTIIIIDVTNSCNLRCPVCPVTFAMHRPRGLMTMEIFRQIIDDFVPEAKKPAIYFNFSGEPTMNKALPDMIAYADSRGHDTFVSTNATKLSPELIERLIKSGLSRINLCIDGFSDIAQESYRVGSKFTQVKANIENFLAIKSATRRVEAADRPADAADLLFRGAGRRDGGLGDADRLRPSPIQDLQSRLLHR